MKNIFYILLCFLFFACENKTETRVLNKYYSIHDDKVFFKDINPLSENNVFEIKEAAAKHFKLIKDSAGNIAASEMNMASDNLNVYYKNLILKGAKPADFVLLKNGFSKDKNNVFFKEKSLSGADAKTFKVLSNYYAKDKNSVWFGYEKVKTEVEINSFQVIDGYFSKDNKNVYLNKGVQLEIFDKVNSETFGKAYEIREATEMSVYFDTKKVLILDPNKKHDDKDFITIFGADTGSFQIITKKYYKDAKKVYYKGIPIPGASADSFKILVSDSTDAYDGLYYYFKGKKVAKANSVKNDK